MVFDERVRILSSAEQADFYNPPVFSQHDQRYFFSLNDIEIAACQKFRSRKIRCMFVVLLGYFKAKPVVLKLGYHQIKEDIKYVFQSVLCSSGFGPFNLTSKENERIYQKIFHLCGYGRWQVRTHKKDLIGHLLVQIEAWVAPRSLFDTTIEYLSLQKIAIPGYSTLQKIISHVVKQAQNQFVAKVIQATSPKLQQFIAEVMSETGELMLHDFRQCAKNFTCKEMEKELFVYKHLNTWMPEINTALQSLSLSEKNQRHFAERIDYYGAKLKHHGSDNQLLFLLCFLQNRQEQALERLADSFVHHVRQHKQKARAYALQVVYQDWQNAANNVSKAADMLRFFIDDSIDQQQSFGAVRQQAMKLLAPTELESVCLFLNEQKRSEDEAVWQYYDQHDFARRSLRKLFLCMQFACSERTKRLTCDVSMR